MPIERLRSALHEHHVAIFRVAFGGWFASLFLRLLPWSAQLYSDAGVLADHRLNPTAPYVPNLLYLFDSPAAVQVFLLAMVALSVAFAVGFRWRMASVLMWVGWAMLWHRNVFTLNPSVPINGFLLLAMAFMPADPPLSVDRWLARRRDPGRTLPAWACVPRDLFTVTWIVTAAAYSYSGLTKLLSGGWVRGEAVGLILDGPLGRDVVWVGWFLDQPWLLALITWGTVAAELLYGPLSLFKKGRPIAWLSMVALHISLVACIQFAELSLSMLLIHLFTFDPTWLQKNPAGADTHCAACSRRSVPVPDLYH